MNETKCTGEGCPIKESCSRYATRSQDNMAYYYVGIPGGWVDVAHKDINLSKQWVCNQYKKIHKKFNIFKWL